MKKAILLLCLTVTFFSCNSGGESITPSSDIIVGVWQLKSQTINGNESINDCTKQTQFIFTDAFILRQVFFSLNNGVCTSGNEIRSSWLNNGDSEYVISSTGGSSRLIKFNFIKFNCEL